MGDATQVALARLHRGLAQRELMADDPRGRSIMDRKLIPTLDALANGLQPDSAGVLHTAPPRKIAIAMALAVFSQPHLSTTFRNTGKPELDPDRRPPLVVSNEVLESALGLSTWELDDLREEVDRRAGGVLKQVTMVNWLSARYPDGRLLFPLLFPGAAGTANPEILKRGPHLYAVVDGPDTIPSALYLPWIKSSPANGLSPQNAFRGRYVDAGLKTALARGIGANPEEIAKLLECALTMIPREDHEAFIRHDRWRSDGYSAVTRVGHSYPELAWLGTAPEPSDLHWEDWLQLTEGTAALRDPIAPFDAITKHRVHHALIALSTDLLARIHADDGPRSETDLDRIDMGPQLRSVLEPILAWTRSKGSATWLARTCGVRPEEAEAMLDELFTQWTSRATYWTDPTHEQFAHSVLAKWVSTLVCLDGSLRQTLARAPDPRWDHREILFLFAAHYIAEAPADRALLAHGLDPAAPGMAIGRWFFPTWERLLDAMEDEQHTTNSEFVIPDGIF